MNRKVNRQKGKKTKRTVSQILMNRGQMRRTLLNTLYRLKKKLLGAIRMVIRVRIRTCLVILIKGRKKSLDQKLFELGILIMLQI